MFTEKVTNAAQHIEGLFLAPASERRRAEAWFAAATKRAKQSGVFSEITKITPAMAEYLLEHNPANRNISARLVNRFANEMTGGRWERNGETIIISDTDELNDGQHRCAASVASGIAFETVVVFGVSRDSRSTLDQGGKRSVGQVLCMNGFADGVHLGHAARIVYLLHTHQTLTRNPDQQPSSSEVMAFLQDHPDLVASMTLGRRAYKARLGSSGLFAGLYYYCGAYSNHSADADAFFEVLVSAFGFRDMREPVYVLHKRLLEKGRLTEAERGAFTIKAFNSWRSKTPMRILKLAVNEQFPLVD